MPESSSPSTKNLQRFAVITGVAVEWLLTGQGAIVSGEVVNATIANDLTAVSSVMETEMLALFRAASESEKSALLQMANLLLQKASMLFTL